MRCAAATLMVAVLGAVGSLVLSAVGHEQPDQPGPAPSRGLSSNSRAKANAALGIAVDPNRIRCPIYRLHGVETSPDARCLWETGSAWRPPGHDGAQQLH